MRYHWAELPYIIREYGTGRSAENLAEEFGVCHTTILRVLEAAEVDRRPTKLYTYDESFFERIDTATKAYWLGFIAADGCVQIGDNHCYSLLVVLHERDVDHINKLREALAATIPVRRRRHFAGVGVHSKKIVLDLISHGIVQRKSLVLRWPTTVPPELRRDFLRGYVDGDGCFYTHNGKSATVPLLGFSVLGTEMFLQEARDFLMGHGLSCNKLQTHGSVKRLDYSGGGAETAFHLMYDDAATFLSRKKETAERILRARAEGEALRDHQDLLKSAERENWRKGIARAFAEGTSIRELANKHNRTPARIYQILDEVGVLRAKAKRFLPDVRERAVAMWHAGTPVKEIAQQVGCSHWVVYGWIGPQRTADRSEIPPEVCKQIRVLYLSGKNCAEVAECVGLHKQRVYNLLCKLGVPRRSPFRFGQHVLSTENVVGGAR